MNKSTYGEMLFETYLAERGIAFEREPPLPGVSQLIDFVVDHPPHGKILLEVKDIENPMPVRGFSAFDPYKPIRTHIDAGKAKFKATADYVCGLVLAAPPGSFVQLEDPHIILGAMYGDLGFTVPFYTGPGPAPPLDESQITSGFLPGRGKMLTPHGARNSRIAAIITIHAFKVWWLMMRHYMHTDDGRTKAERTFDIQEGRAGLPDDMEATEIGVTVWENGIAAKKLPHDMFRGPLDAWYEAIDGEQIRTFVGERRQALGVDK